MIEYLYRKSNGNPNNLSNSFFFNIYRTDVIGKNALMHLCSKRELSQEVLHFALTLFSSKINHRDIFNKTALMNACKENPRLVIIKALVNAGSNINLQDFNEMNCLSYILEQEELHKSIIEYLFQIGIKAKKNSFSIALQNLNNLTYDDLKFLLHYFQKDINANSDLHESVLMILCKNFPNISYIKLLIDHNADVRFVNFQNYNVLTHLLSNKTGNVDLNILQYLIFKGCVVNEDLLDFYLSVGDKVYFKNFDINLKVVQFFVDNYNFKVKKFNPENINNLRSINYFDYKVNSFNFMYYQTFY